MKIKYVFIVVVVLCISLGYIAWGRLQVFKEKAKAAEVKRPQPQVPNLSYDNGLLLKFQQLCKEIDPSAETYQLEGQLLMVDGADSTTAAAKPVAYFVGKNGKDFYCKMGPNEMINANGLLLNIDHQTKMVMVKREQAIPKLNIVPDLKSLVKTLSSEGYELKEGLTNGEAYIKFVNEYHITCKEYKIGYDPVTMKPSSFYLRLTNLDYPTDKQKDKVIALKDLRMSPKFEMNQMNDIPKMIEVDGKLKLTGNLSDYHVIGI